MYKYKIMMLFILCFGSSMALSQGNTQVGRYTTVSNIPQPAQVNPLLAVSEFKFNSEIITIGQAIKLVLENSGYQLISSEKLSNEVTLTLAKPLPITDRNLGPLSIQECLLVLMGKSVFNLQSDPLNRTVNFILKNKIAKKIGGQHAIHRT